MFATHLVSPPRVMDLDTLDGPTDIRCLRNCTKTNDDARGIRDLIYANGYIFLHCNQPATSNISTRKMYILPTPHTQAVYLHTNRPSCFCYQRADLGGLPLSFLFSCFLFFHLFFLSSICIASSGRHQHGNRGGFYRGVRMNSWGITICIWMNEMRRRR
jgi:hypothetical protein